MSFVRYRAALLLDEGNHLGVLHRGPRGFLPAVVTEQALTFVIRRNSIPSAPGFKTMVLILLVVKIK